jgi:hypothetical protein
MVHRESEELPRYHRDAEQGEGQTAAGSVSCKGRHMASHSLQIDMELGPDKAPRLSFFGLAVTSLPVRLSASASASIRLPQRSALLVKTTHLPTCQTC